MDSVKKVLLFSVGVILTVGFITIGMGIFNKCKKTIDGATGKYDDAVAALTGLGDLDQNSSVKGSAVMEMIKDMDSDIVIYVKNGETKDKSAGDNSLKAGIVYRKASGKTCGYGNADSFITYDEALKKATDRKSSLFYINPAAEFTCVSEKDSNGSVSSITFTQETAR